MPSKTEPQIKAAIDISTTQNSTLTGGGLDLDGGTLGTLLGLDARSLALCGTGGVLCLLGLLCRLGGRLLLLSGSDGGSAGGGAGLGALSATLLDHIEGGTDDGTLVLDGLARALLGNLLFVVESISHCSCRASLLVVASA